MTIEGLTVFPFVAGGWAGPSRVTVIWLLSHRMRPPANVAALGRSIRAALCSP